MVNLFDFLFYGSLALIPGVLAMLPIAIVCIRINVQAFQQPIGAKPLRMFINKLVSSYLLSFAKNAAAFFRKSFSFLSSSISF